MQEETRPPLVARFERFARECGKQDSPFYERLSKYVANDYELLTIAAHASREPIPTIEAEIDGACVQVTTTIAEEPLCTEHPVPGPNDPGVDG